jgi:hypothetical protein
MPEDMPWIRKHWQILTLAVSIGGASATIKHLDAEMVDVKEEQRIQSLQDLETNNNFALVWGEVSFLKGVIYGDNEEDPVSTSRSGSDTLGIGSRSTMGHGDSGGP